MENWSTFNLKGIVLLLFFTIDATGALMPFDKSSKKNKQFYYWGFYGHRRINRMAIFTLPPEMIGFYKTHIEYITEHAVDPDKRRYAVAEEGARHYIDIDHYVNPGENPFKVMPRYWKDAVAKYTEDTIKAYGIVPWHIEVMARRLTYALKDKNVDLILKYSTELGHYVGDAHVPLHTSENYNGQMTNQKGIHGLWESRLPELYAEDYDYFVGKAYYVKNINEFAWNAVKASHEAVDSVFLFEKELTKKMPGDQKYSYERRGSATIKTYSQDFSYNYNDMLDGMVERRMRTAIINVGAIWYTCWVNAGQPDLEKLISIAPSAKLIDEDKAIDSSFNINKIKGREHDE
jgi:hypothetical protein